MSAQPMARPQAAAVLISVEPADNRWGFMVLAISRQGDLTNWNLPGGAREPSDADLRHTAARELLEETGVIVDPEQLAVLVHFPRVNHHSCTVFVPLGPIRWPPRLRSDPFEGHPDLVDPDLILVPTSTFHRQNRAALEAAYAKAS